MIRVNGTQLGPCNTVRVNGAVANTIRVDGTIVHQNSCFSGIWSGDTLVPPKGETCCYGENYSICHQNPYSSGIDTSGTQHRIYTSNGNFGAWITSSPAGLGVGTSMDYDTAYDSEFFVTSTLTSIYVGLNNEPSDDTLVSTAAFNITSKFSGVGNYESKMIRTQGFPIYVLIYNSYVDTSGGQMRYRTRAVDARNISCVLVDSPGAWINIV